MIDRTLVFLGPTMPRAEAAAILDAEYHPPARMGDIYRLLSARVSRIVIVDGVFHGVPSVWHREILDALTEGVEVIGASSMGALRAAELGPFGMIGRGTVFAWYRDGRIDGDDEVALVHGDEEAGFRPMSTPLVNLRATIDSLAATGAVTGNERDAIVSWLKGQPYPTRSFPAMAACPVIQSWPATRAQALLRSAQDGVVDVKRLDAIDALRYAASTPAVAAATVATDRDRPERTMWRIGRTLRGAIPSADGWIAGQELLTFLDDPALVAQITAAVARRAFLVAWSRERGLCCPTSVVDRERHRWRAERLPNDQDEVAWLEANGLTRAALDRLLSDRALESWLDEEGPAAFGLAPTSPAADSFLVDWARGHGASSDSDAGRVSKWLLEQGPAHFGLPFYGEAALVDELKLTGRAEQIARARGSTA